MGPIGPTFSPRQIQEEPMDSLNGKLKLFLIIVFFLFFFFFFQKQFSVSYEKKNYLVTYFRQKSKTVFNFYILKETENKS